MSFHPLWGTAVRVFCKTFARYPGSTAMHMLLVWAIPNVPDEARDSGQNASMTLPHASRIGFLIGSEGYFHVPPPIIISPGQSCLIGNATTRRYPASLRHLVGLRHSRSFLKVQSPLQIVHFLIFRVPSRSKKQLSIHCIHPLVCYIIPLWRIPICVNLPTLNVKPVLAVRHMDLHLDHTAILDSSATKLWAPLQFKIPIRQAVRLPSSIRAATLWRTL